MDIFLSILIRHDTLEKASPKGVIIGQHQCFAERVLVCISGDQLINVDVVIDKKTFKRISSILSTLNLQCTPSSLSFWSSVSASDTWASMSRNWRTSGDYSLISLLQNLPRRNRTHLKFSRFCCSLTVFWLHIFEFPKIHILWSLEMY